MRVLVTGLATFWGGRVAQILERDSRVDFVVGLDIREPRVPLERTEFVRTDSGYSILHRIVEAAQIDTIVHAHMVVDSTQTSSRTLHEINVIGTMNLLAAAGAPGSTVSKVVFKSSTLVYGSNHRDPYVFREDMTRTRAASTAVERSLLEAESFLRDFAEDNPHVCVTLLRFANVLGYSIDSMFSRVLRLPLVPEIFGYDPRMQFVHEDDVTSALLYPVDHDIPGVFNVAGDGALPWSEVCTLVNKRRVALPPVFTTAAAEPLGLLRILELPPEMLSLLRYGRSVDNARYKGAGFRYGYSTAGTIDDFARGMRLESVVGATRPTYRYERDVEAFFRHSPAVVRHHEP